LAERISRDSVVRGNPALRFRKELERQPFSSVFRTSQANGEWNVDREHVKGAIKDKVGKLTGDKKLQTEGKIDKAKGSAHKVAGDVRDAVRHARDD
jgi:uncharacterized protein YjbJ (UPF0337 family)